jgi:hypothetical protein
MGYLDELFNIPEAAKVTGRSEMTIRKYLGLTKPPKPSRLPNARKIRRPNDSQDTWAIPLSDLFNAGLMKDTPATAKPAKPAPKVQEVSAAAPVDQEAIILLRIENATLKQRIVDLEGNLREAKETTGEYRLMLGKAIETATTQKARRSLFKRN